MRAELRDRVHHVVHRRIVDRVHRLHDELVEPIGAAGDDVVRLLLEEPEGDRGESDAAARSDREREEALPPFRLRFFHGAESIAALLSQ